MIQYLIYGLFCPFTDSLHYVGKSSVGMIRPLSHLKASHSDKINEWVTQLRFLGYKPVIKILEECAIDNINDKELYWIEKALSDGCYLLNKANNDSSSILSKKEYRLNDYNIKIIGQKIKDVRLDMGINTTDLSEYANISRPTLVSIEKGSGKSTIQSYNNVLEILNLELIAIEKKHNHEPDAILQSKKRIRVPRRKNKVSEA